ncbi:hypothetical protein AAH476_09935, partial [Enterobacter cloacae subsp. cloacae]
MKYFSSDQVFYELVSGKATRDLIYASMYVARKRKYFEREQGNDSNLLIVFYVQIMPDDFVMQLHR